MRYFFSLTLLLLAAFFNTSIAQPKSVYFELGGPGLASFNYDMRFQNTEGGLGGRIGIGGFSVNDGYGKSSAVFLPIGINYLLGKDEKNYFEIGGGITPVFISDSYEDNSGNFSTTFGHLNFGYRLQPKNGGFLFRAGIVPVFNKNGFIPYYFGLSFGYKF